MKSTSVLTALLALCAAFAANAQKVYRCGPDGRIYQQTACAEGRAVDASDPRTTDQRQAAQAVAKSEAKAAARLDAEAASSAPSGKVKSQTSASASAKAASSSKASPDKAQPPPKPQIYLAPKPAASAVKP